MFRVRDGGFGSGRQYLVFSRYLHLPRLRVLSRLENTISSTGRFESDTFVSAFLGSHDVIRDPDSPRDMVDSEWRG